MTQPKENSNCLGCEAEAFKTDLSPTGLCGYCESDVDEGHRTLDGDLTAQGEEYYRYCSGEVDA